jgi:hypothetical protein
VKKSHIFFLIVWVVSFSVSAQSFRFTQPNAGFQTGLVLNVGTHELAVGIQVKGYVGFDYAQLNLGNTFLWKFYSLGDRKRFFENRASAGVVLMVGKNNSVVDFELDGLNHQTQKDFGIAFNYLIYSDNAGTSQLSGAWALHLRNISVRLENDVFGGQGRDRFRTGTLSVSYRSDWYKINAGLFIWTGETKGSFWDKTGKKGMPNGFRSLENLPYGKTTHGIFYGGVQFLLPYGNIVHLRVGGDSEHFRHFFQNRLMHDLVFLPEKIKRNTPHYPRLDENGRPVFEKESVRKTKYYLQFGLNE